MMNSKGTVAAKTVGQAIDEMVCALEQLDAHSRATAVHAVCEQLKIHLPGRLLDKADSELLDIGSSMTVRPEKGPLGDIRSLKEQKSPTSAKEMAVIVAFYLSECAPEGERKSEVSLKDMHKYFIQASYPLPKKPQYLLPNVKLSGYMDSAGHGKYRLNPVGYNLVMHTLPRSREPSSTSIRKSESA